MVETFAWFAGLGVLALICLRSLRYTPTYVPDHAVPSPRSASPRRTPKKSASAAVATGQKYLIIGGNGFLGRWIVTELLNRGETKVAIFDIRSTLEDKRVEVHIGNITKLEDLVAAMKDVDVVIHTASPTHGAPAAIYQLVNVQGTNNVIAACREANVPRLVYTSSGSVVWNGQWLVNGDETLPYANPPLDAYNETKSIAEKAVLDANGKGLATCALRPSGIFGPGEVQGWPQYIEAAKAGNWKMIIGNGKNEFEWTYVENVAYAHVLAADRLNDPAVQGEAFFITNNEPEPMVNMLIYAWTGFGYPLPYLRLPAPLALGLGYASDAFAKLLSPIKQIHPKLTSFRIRLLIGQRSLNIEKAQNLLGYQPRVSLKEGKRRTLAYFRDTMPECIRTQ